MSNLFEQMERRASRLAQVGRSESVELLLDGLSPEMAHLVRVCAIPHQLDFEIVNALGATVLGEQAQRNLEELSRLPVVTFHSEGMAIHDRARRYLFEHWIGPPTNPEFQDLSARLVAYFASRAVADNGGAANFEIQKVFHLIGVDQEDGFEEFEELCREKRHAFSLNDCEKLIKLVHEYDPVLTPERATVLSYHEAKLAADRCQWDKAEELFRRTLSPPTLDPKLKIAATNRLGMVFHAKGDFSVAINCYQKALDLSRARPDTAHFVHRILADLGAAQRDNGDFDEAAKNLNQSVELAREQQHFAGVAQAYNALGTLYHKKQEPFKAIDAYKESLHSLDRAADRFRSAQVLNNLGVVYRELTDWQKSREYLENSRQISYQIGDTISEAQTSHNLMVVYRHLEEPELLLDAAVRAIKLFDESHETEEADATQRDLVKLYGRLTRNDTASGELAEAIGSLRRAGETEKASATLKKLASSARKSRSVWFWIAIIAGSFVLLLFISWIVAKMIE